MSFDFMKNCLIFDDEERFIRLCEGIEEIIREVDDGETKMSDFEIMQALDFVGFNMFRESWEEFKKMELPRNLSFGDYVRSKEKKLPH